MDTKKIYAIIFLFACVLDGIVGEKCETYEDGNGICVEECPEGMRLYSSDCMRPTLSQLTCSQPKPRFIGILCDYTRCDCLKPKVYDEAAKKCVRFTECSKQTVKSTY